MSKGCETKREPGGSTKAESLSDRCRYAGSGELGRSSADYSDKATGFGRGGIHSLLQYLNHRERQTNRSNGL